MDTAEGISVAVALAIVGLILTACVALTWLRRSKRGLAEREAQDRAEALLRDMLTADEYAELAELGYLKVRSPSQPTRVYCVPRGPGRVAVHERGETIESLCVAPVEWLPPSDVILAHKLMIEGDEQEYLSRANRYRLRMPTKTPAIRT